MPHRPGFIRAALLGLALGAIGTLAAPTIAARLIQAAAN